jgi:endonuclease-3 related protein
MHDALFAAYGPQSWWPAETRFEMIVGAYLTQNTAWKAVERSLGNLKSARVLSFEGLRDIPLAELMILIRPSGFSTRKAPALKAFVAMLDVEFAGSLEALSALPAAVARNKLLDLPGVGPETADAILLYALDYPVPVGDEYLRRIVERHALFDRAPGRDRKGYNSLVQLTDQAFAGDPESSRADYFNEFHALIVAVGKAHCGKVPRCDQCPLAADLRLIKPGNPGTRSG